MQKHLAEINEVKTSYYNAQGALTLKFTLSPIARNDSETPQTGDSIFTGILNATTIATLQKCFKTIHPNKKLTPNELIKFIQNYCLSIYAVDNANNSHFLGFIGSIGGKLASDVYHNDNSIFLRNYEKIASGQ